LNLSIETRNSIDYTVGKPLVFNIVCALYAAGLSAFVRDKKDSNMYV